MIPSVGVAIPSIPPRKEMLQRALASVIHQTRVPNQISVVVDHDRHGASVIRNQAWRSLRTTYVAFLDDDDEFCPGHLQRCLETAETTGADLVYPWFYVIGGTDPFPTHFGREWDPLEPRQTTVTCLWRRRSLLDIGGFEEEFENDVDPTGNRIGEDFLAVRRLNEIGGKIVHVPERTWKWYHHLTNTSGLPARW